MLETNPKRQVCRVKAEKRAQQSKQRSKTTFKGRGRKSMVLQSSVGLQQSSGEQPVMYTSDTFLKDLDFILMTKNR